MPNNKKFTFTEAVNDALHISMKKDKKMICYGLGVTDPKNVFSTTLNLKKKFGSNRVFDVPTSENALTGVGVGAGAGVGVGVGVGVSSKLVTTLNTFGPESSKSLP